MSIITQEQKDFVALYRALKLLIDRRKLHNGRCGVDGLGCSDGRYKKAEKAILDAEQSMKDILGVLPDAWSEHELYRR